MTAPFSHKSFQTLFEKAKIGSRESSWAKFCEREKEAYKSFFESLVDLNLKNEKDSIDHFLKDLEGPLSLKKLKTGPIDPFSGNQLFEVISKEKRYVLKVYQTNLIEALEEALASQVFHSLNLKTLKAPSIINAARMNQAQSKRIFFLMPKVDSQTFDSLMKSYLEKNRLKKEMEESFSSFGKALYEWHYCKRGLGQKKPLPLFKEPLLELYKNAEFLLRNQEESLIEVGELKKYFNEMLSLFFNTKFPVGFMHGDLHFGNMGLDANYNSFIFDLSSSFLSFQKKNIPHGIPHFDVHHVLSNLLSWKFLGLTQKDADDFSKSFLEGYSNGKNFDFGLSPFFTLIETLKAIPRFLDEEEVLSKTKEIGKKIVVDRLKELKSLI